MKSDFKRMGAIMVLIALSFACKKDKKTFPTPDIYVAGNYLLQDGQTQSACYWKNGEFFPVKDSSQISKAYSIAIINGSVYLVGFFNEQPCYWKDGERFTLPKKDAEVFMPGSQATSICQFRGWGLDVSTPTFVGNGVFNGILPNSRYIWQPAAAAKPVNVLDDGSQPGNYIFKAKTSDATHLYFVGDHTDGKAGYWLVSFLPNVLDYQIVWHDLSNTPGATTDIDFDQNNIYVLGFTVLNGVQSHVYWKNDQLIPLNLSAPQVSINSFRVKDGSVYLVGEDTPGADSQACIWINSTKTILSPALSTATGLTFYGTDTFISGTVGARACYWKGTTLVDLNRNKSQAVAIVVQAKP